jgi:hypothetical protein
VLTEYYNLLTSKWMKDINEVVFRLCFYFFPSASFY